MTGCIPSRASAWPAVTAAAVAKRSWKATGSPPWATTRTTYRIRADAISNGNATRRWEPSAKKGRIPATRCAGERGTLDERQSSGSRQAVTSASSGDFNSNRTAFCRNSASATVTALRCAPAHGVPRATPARRNILSLRVRAVRRVGNSRVGRSSSAHLNLNSATRRCRSQKTELSESPEPTRKPPPGAKTSSQKGCSGGSSRFARRSNNGPSLTILARFSGLASSPPRANLRTAAAAVSSRSS